MYLLDPRCEGGCKEAVYTGVACSALLSSSVFQRNDSQLSFFLKTVFLWLGKRMDFYLIYLYVGCSYNLRKMGMAPAAAVMCR